MPSVRDEGGQALSPLPAPAGPAEMQAAVGGWLVRFLEGEAEAHAAAPQQRSTRVADAESMSEGGLSEAAGQQLQQHQRAPQHFDLLASGAAADLSPLEPQLASVLTAVGALASHVQVLSLRVDHISASMQASAEVPASAPPPLPEEPAAAPAAPLGAEAGAQIGAPALEQLLCGLWRVGTGGGAFVPEPQVLGSAASASTLPLSLTHPQATSQAQPGVLGQGAAAGRGVSVPHVPLLPEHVADQLEASSHMLQAGAQWSTDPPTGSITITVKALMSAEQLARAMPGIASWLAASDRVLALLTQHNFCTEGHSVYQQELLRLAGKLEARELWGTHLASFLELDQTLRLAQHRLRCTWDAVLSHRQEDINAFVKGAAATSHAPGGRRKQRPQQQQGRGRFRSDAPQPTATASHKGQMHPQKRGHGPAREPHPHCERRASFISSLANADNGQGILARRAIEQAMGPEAFVLEDLGLVPERRRPCPRPPAAPA